MLTQLERILLDQVNERSEHPNLIIYYKKVIIYYSTIFYPVHTLPSTLTSGSSRKDRCKRMELETNG